MNYILIFLLMLTSHLLAFGEETEIVATDAPSHSCLEEIYRLQGKSNISIDEFSKRRNLTDKISKPSYIGAAGIAVGSAFALPLTAIIGGAIGVSELIQLKKKKQFKSLAILDVSNNIENGGFTMPENEEQLYIFKKFLEAKKSFEKKVSDKSKNKDNSSKIKISNEKFAKLVMKSQTGALDKNNPFCEVKNMEFKIHKFGKKQIEKLAENFEENESEDSQLISIDGKVIGPGHEVEVGETKDQDCQERVSNLMSIVKSGLESTINGIDKVVGKNQ